MFEGDHAALLQPYGRAECELAIRELGQSGPAPQSERLAKHPLCAAGVTGVEHHRALVGEQLETSEVDVVGVDVESIARGVRNEHATGASLAVRTGSSARRSREM